MTLPPNDHDIPLKDAIDLVTRYRIGAREKAGAFHADAVRRLLDQPGCTGIRIYPGRHSDGTGAFVLVGLDDMDRDMTKGLLLDIHYPCPPYCDDTSPLSV